MMKLKEYIGNKSLPSANIAVGIDIGSRQAKAVLLKNDEFYTALTATGFDMTETAETLISELLNVIIAEQERTIHAVSCCVPSMFPVKCTWFTDNCGTITEGGHHRHENVV